MSTKRFGKLHTQYDFFLNPYDDLRFTRCPKCNTKTGHRKLPLVIWVEPQYPISLNYTCRYCQTCDLLIAHKNEIDNLLAKIFHARAPGVVVNSYTIIGTMEKSAWKQSVQKHLDFQNILEHLHDFNQALKFKLTPNLSEAGPLQIDTQTVIRSDRSGKREHKEGVSTHNSLDDVTKAINLVEMMKLALPITARPTNDLVNALKKQRMQLDPYRDVQIKDVFYMGDEGGVTCDITPLGKETTPVLCSITHLLIPREHPFFSEISLYQKVREGRLAENFGLAGFTINRKKRH